MLVGLAPSQSEVLQSEPSKSIDGLAVAGTPIGCDEYVAASANKSSKAICMVINNLTAPVAGPVHYLEDIRTDAPGTFALCHPVAASERGNPGARGRILRRTRRDNAAPCNDDVSKG